MTACTLCARAEAKSDLVNVLSSLEAHWHVLEAEVIEINRDIEYSEQCLRKYGEWFNSPLQYLRELKRTKKNKMCAAPTARRPQRARRLLRATQHARYTHSQPQSTRRLREAARPPVWPLVVAARRCLGAA